jgi:hypothetical protein
MDLAQYHETLMGVPPDEDQLKLYQAAPESRGFLEIDRNRRRLLAVVIMALWLAQPVEGSQTCRKVLLIFPPTHEKWALETIRVVAKHVLSRASLDAPFYNVLVSCISSLQMGSRIFGIDEPDLWVTYGFVPSAPVPEWLKRKVLEVPDAES